MEWKNSISQNTQFKTPQLSQTDRIDSLEHLLVNVLICQTDPVSKDMPISWVETDLRDGKNVLRQFKNIHAEKLCISTKCPAFVLQAG